MAFLGHTISSEGLQVDLRNTKAMKSWPRPLYPIDIRSFLGLDGYYISFVDEFASITSPLIILTQKNVKFEWSVACEKRFQMLKDTFTSALVLTLPKGTKCFVVY